MHRSRRRNEMFKIFEYTEMTILQPKETKQDMTMIFFAGFNENASKYLYQFKSFFEEFDYKIRIVIPNMPIVTVETNEQPGKKKKTQSFFAWYDWSLTDGKMQIKYNENKDKQIINLIKKEIKQLDGDTSRLIFAGFSMGGRYGMHILTQMKIKVAFFAVFKSIVVAYENPHMDKEDAESLAFMQNNFYLYFSLHDRIVQVPYAYRTIDTFKRCKFNFQVKVDNEKPHSVDDNCLSHLERLLFKHFYMYLKPKF